MDRPAPSRDARAACSDSALGIRAAHAGRTGVAGGRRGAGREAGPATVTQPTSRSEPLTYHEPRLRRGRWRCGTGSGGSASRSSSSRARVPVSGSRRRGWRRRRERRVVPQRPLRVGSRAGGRGHPGGRRAGHPCRRRRRRRGDDEAAGGHRRRQVRNDRHLGEQRRRLHLWPARRSGHRWTRAGCSRPTTGAWSTARSRRCRTQAPGGGARSTSAACCRTRRYPLQGHYAASKHAVKGFTRFAAHGAEHEGAPVSVTLIQPAAIDTPYPEHAKSYLGVEPTHQPPVYAPEVVARAILASATGPGATCWWAAAPSCSTRSSDSPRPWGIGSRARRPSRPSVRPGRLGARHPVRPGLGGSPRARPLRGSRSATEPVHPGPPQPRPDPRGAGARRRGGGAARPGGVFGHRD